MLKLAAITSGLEYLPRDPQPKNGLFCLVVQGNGSAGWREWKPHTNDGDAFLLAVRIQATIKLCPRTGVTVSAEVSGILSPPMTENGPCIAASTRRALVRAAAAIGEQIFKNIPSLSVTQ
jgi:hypothetical protein